MIHFSNSQLESALASIAEHALAEWAPEAEIHVSPMASGLSGAALLSADISGEAAGELGGVHILKVATGDGRPRESRSGEARAADFGDFAEKHVPRVLRHWSGVTAEEAKASGSAILLEIAGGSLRRYTAPTRRRSEPLQTFAKRLVQELTVAWTDLSDVTTGSVRDFIHEALGVDQAEEALRLADDFYGVTDSRTEHRHTFLSPARLLGRPAQERFVRAFRHGDLHTGNLILPVESSPDGDDFWLIDFDRAGEGYFGQDIAYLELSIICDFYDHLTGPSLASCLSHAEDPTHSHLIPDDLQWLAEFMRNTRAALTEFGATTAGRADDLERQMIIARIAEALRWARRFPEQRKSKVALFYAGWYVTHLEGLDGDPAVSAAAEGGGDGDLDLADKPLEGTDLEVWQGLWGDAGHFARRDWTYVLIAERIGNDTSLGALGSLPLSAVVNLDPSSDTDGLHSHAEPVLASSRAVHVFSEDPPVSDDKRGAAWLMSAGWRLRREPAVNYRTWRRTKLRHVRGLFEELRQRTGDSPVFVLTLAGQYDADDAAGDADRLVQVLEAADEVWGERAALHVVSDARVRRAVPLFHHPIAATSFVRQLATVYGAEETATHVRLPSGPDGTVVVEQDVLQIMREYFEVLHDRIDTEGGEEEQENDAFWRGGQVLWSDLAEERDVPREVGSELNQEVLSSLEQHRTHTVVLEHRPGAGGTTAALRAAWDVHGRFPVAVLRRGQAVDRERVRKLAERLHRLFVLTESPVLLVAEAADLPEANREQLYRELASHRARITLLYIRRSLSPRSNGLSVTDPLSDQEAGQFLSRFRQLTEDPDRIAELQLLSAPPFERYRTPFFYGLTTFQRDFTKLGDYVSHYLREVAGRARDILAHLAFVTLYSNTGLQLGLIHRLFRQDSASDQMTIEDLLGSAAALVVHRAGRYQIAHPLLAEELLIRLTGAEEWREHLQHVALDFIEDVAAVGDTAGDPIRTLLRQIFIDREPTDEMEDRVAFAGVIEDLDAIDVSIGHGVLRELTNVLPDESHFWNHLGRHQIHRLKRDYDVAEQNLEHAISLAPRDPLHYHTLGLARRARLKEGLKTARGQGPEAMMSVIERRFERTVDCFRESRSLAPDDIYGYTTHVQTILDAAQHLQRAAAVDSIANLPAGASEWALEQITIANTLLEDASQLYGTLEPKNDYLQRCEADVFRLYGDLDAVIELWEDGDSRGNSTPFSRRALAQAYLVRANRSWRALNPPELWRIVSLSESNLGRATAREEDYRLWFEASKLLPDFDVERALGNLELWSSRLPSWRAAYYRYVLHFLLWLTERSEDTDTFRSAQEECSERSTGRVDHSHIWLSKDPGWCPLVTESDLGEWNRQQRFWHDTSMLRRVNGAIDFINGYSSGNVLIGDSHVQAFFVPGVGGFMSEADENTPVNFFIGFRPSGLRAWDVQRGHVEEAITRGGEPLAMPMFISRPRDANYEEVQRERAKSLRASRVRELVQSFAKAALDRSPAVRLRWIEERVLATAGVGSSTLINEDSVRRMVSVLDGIKIEERVNGAVATRSGRGTAPANGEEELEVGFVSHFDRIKGLGRISGQGGEVLQFSVSDLHSESPTEVRRNAVVRFLPSRDRRADRALQVQMLPDATLYEGRIIRSESLGRLVQDEISRILEDLSAKEGRGSVKAEELEDRLKQAFRGGLPLENRLGVVGLRAFLRDQQWLVVSGQSGDQRVGLAQPLGRSYEAIGAADDGTASGPRAAAHELYEQLRRQHPSVTVQMLARELSGRLGPSKYGEFVGSRGPKQALEDLGDWEVVRIDDKPEVRPVARHAEGGNGSQQGGGGEADKHEIVRAAAERVKRQHREISLQVLGDTLKEDLGDSAYEAFIAPKRLKGMIESLGEWTLTEVRQGHILVEPLAAVNGPVEGSALAPEDGTAASVLTVDQVGKLIEEVEERLHAKGKSPSPQAIGTYLQQVAGDDSYRAFVGSKGLVRTLKGLGLWNPSWDKGEA